MLSVPSLHFLELTSWFLEVFVGDCLTSRMASTFTPAATDEASKMNVLFSESIPAVHSLTSIDSPGLVFDYI